MCRMSIVLLASFAAVSAQAADMALPPLKAQSGAQMVVEEHVDALNQCDWNRLMAQYPPEIEIHLPDGVIVAGREKIGDLFAGFCKDRKDGGLKGLKFTAEHVYTVDDTLNVQWRAEADFLKEPYKGSDAYVTKDGLMYAQVTTFNGADLKFK